MTVISREFPPLVAVPLPWDLDHRRLELDPSSTEGSEGAVMSHVLFWFGENIQTDDELARIILGAAALWTEQDRLASERGELGPSMARCLDTAMVWERG